jgi:S1-C subfamily serine protease
MIMSSDSQRSFRSRVAGFLYIGAIVPLLVSGCSGFNHGWTTREYTSRMVSVAEPYGLRRLHIEADFDPTIAKYISDRGMPSHLYVFDIKNVALIYVSRDEAVMFHRAPSGVRSTYSTAKPIPDDLLKRLPAAVQTAITSSRSADSSSEIMKKRAVSDLARMPSSPFPCDPGYQSVDGYIVALTDWVERAGLRRGDKVINVRTRTSITVERSGNHMEVAFPCRDDSARWKAFKRLYESAARGDWDECETASMELSRVGPRGTLHEKGYRYECARLSALSRGRPWNDSRAGLLLYELARARLEEAAYVPGQVDRVRGVTLTTVEQLRKGGALSLATDLESKLASATQVPGTGPSGGGTTAPEESRTASHGTGFAVSPDGLILTAWHVIDGAKNVIVACPGRKPLSAAITQVSRNLDLATVTVPISGLSYLSFADVRIRPGDTVFTIGFPVPDILGREPKYTDGAISALSGPGGEASFLQISVPVQPGNSGGPLVDNAGRVVGVVTASAAIAPFLRSTGTLPQNVNWAVKAEYAKPLLNSTISVPNARTRADAVDLVKRATCLIETFK